MQLDYDGQRKRTKVRNKDLDPTWNEKVRSNYLSVCTLGSLASSLVVRRERGKSSEPSSLSFIRWSLTGKVALLILQASWTVTVS